MADILDLESLTLKPYSPQINNMNNLNLSPVVHAFAMVGFGSLCTLIIVLILFAIKKKIGKEQECFKLLNYKRMIESSKKLPVGYKDDKLPELEAIDWLIAYYEGRASEEPIALFESMLNLCRDKEVVDKDLIRFAAFIYHWDKYRLITNF